MEVTAILFKGFWLVSLEFVVGLVEFFTGNGSASGVTLGPEVLELGGRIGPELELAGPAVEVVDRHSFLGSFFFRHI